MKHAAGAREPLLNRAAITALVGIAVSLGLISTDLSEHLVVVLTALAPLAAAWWARGHVTPVADPRTDTGTPLVPAAGEAG